jgi:hypothetical protein
MTQVKLGTGAYKERFLQDWDYCLKHFDVLELQDFIMPDNLDNSEIIDEYLGMLSGFNGEITLHGPYLNLAPTSIDNKVKEVAELRYLQAVEAANKFGADQLVIHSFYDTTTGYSKYDGLWLEGNALFWDAFLPKVKGSGVTILLENVHDRIPDTFAKLQELLDSSQISTCVAMIIVLPSLWRFSKISKRSSWPEGSRNAVGSSSTIISGSMASTPAMATRFF